MLCLIHLNLCYRHWRPAVTVPVLILVWNAIPSDAAQSWVPCNSLACGRLGMNQPGVPWQQEHSPQCEFKSFRTVRNQSSWGKSGKSSARCSEIQPLSQEWRFMPGNSRKTSLSEKTLSRQCSPLLDVYLQPVLSILSSSQLEQNTEASINKYDSKKMQLSCYISKTAPTEIIFHCTHLSLPPWFLHFLLKAFYLCFFHRIAFTPFLQTTSLSPDVWLSLSTNIWIRACFKWAITIAMKSLHFSGDLGILKFISHKDLP